MSLLRRREAQIALAVYAVVVTLAQLLGWGPDPLRVAALVGLLGAGYVLVAALPVAEADSWTVTWRAGSSLAGQDARWLSHQRVLEDHRTADVPHDALRRRLAGLAEARLSRHGTTLGEPEAAALLGPEEALLTRPGQRLTPTQIDRLLTRMEEL